MNKLMLTIFALPLLSISGCNVLPFERSIDPGEARLVNFVRHVEMKKEFLAVVCTDEKIPGFVPTTDVSAGERKVLVKAMTYKKGIPNSFRDAYYEFNVHLEEGKRYQLNRKADDNHMYIWIQEQSTGQRVSAVVEKELSYPINRTSLMERQMCEEDILQSASLMPNMSGENAG